MKKLLTILFVFSFLGGVFAQVEYEHVGSIYDFWQPTKFRVNGDYAYVAINYNDEINIYNISDPNNISFVKRWITGSGHIQTLNFYDNYLYTNSTDDVLRIYDLTDPTTPTLLVELANGPYWKDNPGSPHNDGTIYTGQYLLQYNFNIWDFTDPLNPVEIFNQTPYYDAYGWVFPGKFTDNIYFRSWHYNLGYPVDVITRVLDVSDPSTPVNLGEYDQIHALNLHSNALQEDSLNYDGGAGWSGQDWFSKLNIRNFADPFNPVEVGEISWDFPNGENSYIYGKVDNYVFVKDKLNDLEQRLHSINVADPANPSIGNTYEVQASSAPSNPEFQNNFFSWMDVSTHFVMIDITDPLNPVETLSPPLADDPNGGPLNVLEVEGNYAFLAKADPQGSRVTTIYIVDISDPENLIEAGSFELVGKAIRLHLLANGNYVYAAYEDFDQSSINRKRLVIYDVSDPANPILKSNTRLVDLVIDQIRYHNGYLYVVNYYSDVYDVSDPSNPFIAYSYPDNHTEKLHDICFDGNLMYDIYLNFYLILRDVTDPLNPVTLGTAYIPSTNRMGSDIKYRNGKIYSKSNFQLRIHDVSNFSNITLLGNYVWATDILDNDYSIDDNYAYFSTNDGTQIIDIIDPTNPVLAEVITVPGYVTNAVEVVGNYVYTANNHSFDIYQLQLPLPPEDFDLISPSGSFSPTETDLTWENTEDPNGSAVSFDVYLATTSDFSDQYKVAEGITETTFHISDLMIGQTYYWKVHAKDDNTSGTWSSNNLSFSIASPAVTVIFETNIGGETKGGVSVLDDNTIYVPSSSKVARLKSDGSIEYTLNVNGIIKSSSTITSDHTVYIASTDNNLYSFNSNGVTNPNWPVALGAQATASVAVGPSDNLYIGTGNGIFQAISRGGDILWSYNVGAAVYSSSVISSTGTLYVINKNGRLYAFDLNNINISNVQYKWKLELGESVSSSPALDGSGNIYVTTESGKLLKVSDSDNAGTTQWTFNSNGECESSPVIDGSLNVYFTGAGGKVFSVNGSDGTLNWETETHYSHSNPSAILKASPTLSDDGGRIYAGDTFGTLYGISTATGKIVWVKKESGLIEGPILAVNNKIYFCKNGTVAAFNEPATEPGSKVKKNGIQKAVENDNLWATFQGNAMRTGYNGESFTPQYANILALRENDSDGIPILIDSIKSITGIITASNHFGSKGPAFIQDSEAGVSIYGKSFVDLISLGDSITVTGRLGFFSGLTQLTWDSVNSAVIVHRNLDEPVPGISTIDNILNQSWNWLEREEGKLVKIENVTFEVSGVFEANTNYSFTDGNNSLNVRIDNDVNLISENIPVGEVDLVGCVGQYKSQAPYNSGYQLLLRTISDIKIKTDVEKEAEVPTAYALNQNYPNPFNPTTIIRYSIPSSVNSQSSFVNLVIFDALGAEVKTLVNEQKIPGSYKAEFDASELPSGIYFYRIIAGKYSETKKMLLLK